MPFHIMYGRSATYKGIIDNMNQSLQRLPASKEVRLYHTVITDHELINLHSQVAQIVCTTVVS